MKRLGVALVIGLMLAVPLVNTGAAYRSSFYDYEEEPGVGDPVAGTLDFDSDKMWPGANQDPVDKIYFDAHYSSNAVEYPNPPGTALRSHGLENAFAYLGFWRDCNKDGFMGDALTGAISYPIASAVAQSDDNGAELNRICPANSEYQDGVYFHEFLSIGRNARDIDGADEDRLLLCPDRNKGPSDSENTWRANGSAGVLAGNGGSNILCTGGAENYAQDDYAKVWGDHLLPTETPRPSRAVTPLPDGTMRDSNGLLRYVDSYTFGNLGNTLGVWPVKQGATDPAASNQCSDTDDAADVTATLANAQGWNGQLGAASNCSPVPNVAYVTVPVAGPVAWPGHLAEDRMNNSESANKHGDPITEPYEDDRPNDETNPNGSGTCTLQTDPDTWDEDPNDGDPFYGGQATDTEYWKKYYGPNDDGPSLDYTIDRLLSGLFWEVDQRAGTEDSCNGGNTIFGANERHGTAGDQESAGKTSVDWPLWGYGQNVMFNPSTAPGGPAPDANMCVVIGSERCGGQWTSAQSWILHYAVLAFTPDPAEIRHATFYADVSFGIHLQSGGFDTAGDGPFELDDDGVWDVAPFNADPATALPGGANDAFQYGDEQCDGVGSLGAGDYIGPGTAGTTAPVPTWNCERLDWAKASQFDPALGAGCDAGEKEKPCFDLAKVGDAYDLWDIECKDNDVLDQEVNSQVPGGRDCDTLG